MVTARSNIGLINDLFTIKKLFTEAYYDYRFSSLFISTINNMVNMTIPKVQKIEYNDQNKYIEVQANLSDKDKPISIFIEDVLSTFIRFCYEDKTMREILESVNLFDFKVFDLTMRSIYESRAYGINNFSEVYISSNIFNVIAFGKDIIRINLT